MRMNAFDRGKVERFATLPPGEAYPEGIDADAEGNVYVVTVGANKPDTSPGSLFVFDPNGKLLRTVHTEGTSPWLLDLRFQPNTGKLLVVDYLDSPWAAEVKLHTVSKIKKRIPGFPE
jgi:DNA-binding beta-propeller fold protein YncE